MYKTKLLENNEAGGDNGILKNVAIAALLKYLSNLWRSLEMPLINCLYKRHKLICSCCNFISKRQSKAIKRFEKDLVKDLKDLL